jgi:hypothetical protein
MKPRVYPIRIEDDVGKERKREDKEYMRRDREEWRVMNE